MLKYPDFVTYIGQNSWLLMYSRLKNKLIIEVFIWIHYTAFCIICNILTFSIWLFSQNTKGLVIMKDNKYKWRIEESVKGEFGADGNLKDSQVKSIHHPSRYPSPVTAPDYRDNIFTLTKKIIVLFAFWNSFHFSYWCF